ncbi:MAG: hypothetical protein ACRD4C_06910 [Candidatus Acidiferrales bacterium]
MANAMKQAEKKAAFRVIKIRIIKKCPSRFSRMTARSMANHHDFENDCLIPEQAPGRRVFSRETNASLDAGGNSPAA